MFQALFQCLTYVSSFHSHSDLIKEFKFEPRFTDEQAQAQGG